MPEVTKDIEARAAQLAAKGGVPALAYGAAKTSPSETVNLCENYLKRLEELVCLDALRKAKAKLAVDALHGCGAGYLDRIHFTDGQLVKQGDLLFTIDKRPLQTTLDQAKANLQQAQANLAFTEADLARGAQLVKERTITEQTFDQRTQAKRVAEASVAALTAAVRQASLDLGLDLIETAGRVHRAIDRDSVTAGDFEILLPMPGRGVDGSGPLF